MTAQELFESFHINFDHLPIKSKELAGIFDTLYLILTEEQAHQLIHTFFQHADEIYNMEKSTGARQ